MIGEPLVYKFFVPGNPEPMPRARATAFRGFVRFYTKKGAWKAWSERIALTCRHYNLEPHDGPVSMKLDFLVALPKSSPKKLSGCYCFKKPDIDNMEKLVLDTLKNAGWFTDDGRVVAVQQSKVYTTGEPGLEITINLLPHGARP